MNKPARSVALALAALAATIATGASSAQQAQSEDTEKALRAQADRARVIYERGRAAHYSQKFDLSELPHYAPQQQYTGWIRLHGNNYLSDGMLGELWQQGFAKYQPGIRISYFLPTSALAFAALYYNQADVVMGHRPGFYDLLAYERVMNFDPVEITAVTGSFDVGGWENSVTILVNEDNPLKCINMEQLDGVFGAARDGGWAGTNWRSEWARGPDKNIRTWGQLGLTGEWANRPINVYGFSLRYNTATDFSDRVLKSSDKWNENIHGYGNIVNPDGSRTVEADQITDHLGKDLYGIAYNRFRGNRAHVKRLAVAAGAGKACIEHTIDNVQNRTYPLYNEQYFYTSVKPGTAMDPKVKEFLRYVLSQEGQAEVMRDGKYLPLTADVVREQLKKLESRARVPMRNRRILVSAAAMALMALPLHAAVTVSYGDPDHFTDAGDRNSDPRKVMLTLERYFKELGGRYLPAESNLRIEVIDLDRAGRPYMNLPGEIRIITGKADMPCIELSYTLEIDNKALPPRRERVCDPDYLRALEPQYDEHDPLVYEKRMLEQWFRQRFAKTTPPR